LEFLQHAFPWLPSLQEIIQTGGVLAIALIVFAETGLLVGFFLPGDSLLVTAGVFAANGDLRLDLLLILLPIAAILGNAIGYQIGKRAGGALYSRPNSRLFKRAHLLRAHAFYEKHGGKTIIIARFVPIVRTFAPTVAGAAEMGYPRFLKFDLFGGTFWPWSMVLVGYGSARLVPNLDRHIHIVVPIVIFISILPGIIETLRARREGRKERLRNKQEVNS
jgi:membrane-associated protein